MVIQTNRLIIRASLESDVPGYAAVVADPEVTRFLGDGSPHSYEQAAAYVHNCIRSEAKEDIARYAVIFKETDKLIGFCGFKKVYDNIDFGWRYARQAWGHAYATEAAVAVLDYGTSTLKLCGIAAESAVENVWSVRVMEKIGMQLEAFGEVRRRITARYRQPGKTD